MEWQMNRIYQFEEQGEWFTFVSPDGRGRHFYNNVAHARAETGIQSVVHLMYAPD